MEEETWKGKIGVALCEYRHRFRHILTEKGKHENA